jgi:hypothetical protein
MAFNVPHQVMEACSEDEFVFLPKQPSHALKHCTKSLLAHEGIIDQKGGFCFAVKVSSKEEDMIETETENRVHERNHDREHAGLDHTDIIWIALGKHDGIELTHKEDCYHLMRMLVP